MRDLGHPAPGHPPARLCAEDESGVDAKLREAGIASNLSQAADRDADISACCNGGLARLVESIVKTLTETLMNRMLKRVFLLSATVALSGTVLLAQGHPGGAPPNPTHGSSDTNNPVNPNADDPMARDRAFAKKSLENGYAVVKMSELAQQNSQRDDVKQFAQKAADDQKQTNGRLEQYAKQLGMELPTEPSHKKNIAKLQGLNGPKFDQEYLSTMQKVQQEDVKGYSEEAGKTTDPTLQNVLKQDGATISSHVETIKTLSKGQGGK